MTKKPGCAQAPGRRFSGMFNVAASCLKSPRTDNVLICSITVAVRRSKLPRVGQAPTSTVIASDTTRQYAGVIFSSCLLRNREARVPVQCQAGFSDHPPNATSIRRREVPLAQLVCPVCLSPRRSLLSVLNRWGGVDWPSVRCRSCGHRYVSLMPTDDELKVMYSDSYFGEGGAWVCAYWKGSYIDNEQNLRREAGAALAELGLPSVGGNHLLEIGSAGGFFLDEARRSGYDVLGIELNESMAEFARD